MKKFIIGLGGLALIAAIYWQFTNDSNANTATQAYKSEIALVEKGDVARLVSASGSVRALTTVEVGSQVSGQIIELNADFNSKVQEGQIIAKLDPQTFESRLLSAEADVASAKANLDVLKAQISSAEANLSLFESDYQRQTELFNQKLIPRSLLDDAKRQFTVGQSSLKVTKAQLRSGQASLAQREASLNSAKVDLERTIVRSPITGVVIERNVDVGQTVAASLSAPILFRIAQDLRDIRIDADVVESDIGGIDQGDTVTFTVDAYPNDEFTGTVEQVRLASQEIQNVVTYTVVIASENRGGNLLPGMTANVEITAEKRSDVLRLSETTTRFRPPADGPEVKADTDSQSPNRRGGGRGAANNMLSELNLEPKRAEAIQAEIGAEMRKVRESMGQMAQFDRNRMRQLFRTRIERVLKKNLSDEEFAQYENLQKQQNATRRVSLYQENPDGSLSTKNLRVGLSDGSFIEVLSGAEVGDKFVTRLRKVQEDK